MGGVFQQAVSSVTETDQNCYELKKGCFSVYGFEYVPGFDDAVRPLFLPQSRTMCTILLV